MKINITAEQLVQSLTSTHGDNNVTGPTDLKETEEDVFFNIIYFQQPLKVIFNKTYGQINSSPFNRDFLSKACAINENNKQKEDSTPSATSTTPPSSKKSLIYVTPEQIVSPLLNTYGTANISGPTEITETDDSLLFNMVYFGQALRVILCKTFGTINSSPFNRELVAHACSIHEKYKPKVDPSAPKISKIYTTAEEIIESFTSVHGVGSVAGPTDLTETEDDIFFNIIYFQQPLKVVLNKTNGTINSSPYNRDFVSKASLVNENNKKKESSASSTPTSSTPSTPTSSTPKQSLLYVTPEQIVSPLLNTYGTANISGPTEITETDDSLLFNMVYFGQDLRVMCSKTYGTINSSPFNRDFVPKACEIHQKYKPKVDPNAPKISKIYTTAEEIIESFTSVHGVGSVAGPTDLTETKDDVFFNIIYFQQPLKVVLNKTNGTINSSPYNRDFVSKASLVNENNKKKLNK